jgi:hypothetical protein
MSRRIEIANTSGTTMTQIPANSLVSRAAHMNAVNAVSQKIVRNRN